jgi:hypothetical protein
VSTPQKRPDKPLTPRHAWQPFTPRGVAAFAQASALRLFLVQLVVATSLVIALLWSLRVAWVPVISEAIQHLPETGIIRGGELTLGGETPQRLAENPRLGVAVDLNASGEAGRVAEVEVTFERRQVVVRGPLGNWSRAYGSHYIISFNRVELIPWWDAWRWTFYAGVTVATFLWLFVSWWALAFIYLPLTKLIAFFADRGLTWRGGWRMNMAALIPGACLMAGALLLHAFGAVDFFQFSLLYLLHLIAGLIFVCTSPFFLPKVTTAAPQQNPFGESAETGQSNPFSNSQT